MLDTEAQWSEALASNKIRVVIRWLRKFTDEGEGDMEKILQTFSCWVQRTSEFAKKELLTLCFSRCQGLWMFLDRSSFSRVHMLLQRLRNLLTLTQWARKQFNSVHLWHGVEIPCVVCRDTTGSSDARLGCWNREHRALKQHIWLGNLVQWWGIMGLLPKHPEPHEMKRISQMWKEIVNSHRKACLEKPGWSSFIQGMVTHLDKRHGCIWTFEDCTDKCYPPPNLQALLKLVLVPHIDNMSVQAIIMYFILDVANFLQCKDDLLQSFVHAFTIPSSFSQQIRAFWMLDHGHIKASVELLLSPRTAAPWLSWQHRCIIRCLLTTQQPLLALRYLRWTRPIIECTEDAKLCAEVLLQNSCVSEAWTVLKRCHTDNEDMVMYFFLCCNGFGLNSAAYKYIPAEYNFEGGSVNAETTGLQWSLMKNKCLAGIPPCPLSAKLYQAQKQNTVSPEELVRLVREAVMEVRPQPKISVVVWPEHTDRKSNSREMFLSTQALCRVTPSPVPMNMIEETEETAHTDELEEEQPALYNQPKSLEHISSNEDLSSISSFTSASSLPLLRHCYHYVYESTLTLKRISSLLTDGEYQSMDDEEGDESRTPSSVNILPDCPELMLTPDGTTHPISLSNLNKDILEEPVLSAEGEYGDTGVSSSQDILSVNNVLGPNMSETLPLNESFWVNCPLSNDVPSMCEPQVERHSLVPSEHGKVTCCKEVRLPNVTDQWSTALSLEDQSHRIHPSCSSSETAASDCFLEEETQQKEFKQAKSLGCFTRDLNGTLSETTQNLLADPHQNLLLEEPTVAGSRVFEGIDNKKPSFAQSQLYCLDLTAKQKEDNRDDKQADKDKLAGWSSLGRTSQGAIRSGRTRLRKGKRVKKA